MESLLQESSGELMAECTLGGNHSHVFRSVCAMEAGSWCVLEQLVGRQNLTCDVFVRVDERPVWTRAFGHNITTCALGFVSFFGVFFVRQL